MRANRYIAVAAALFTAALPARADQVLRVLGAAQVRSDNKVVLPGGPTLGLWQNGKYTSTPDAVQTPSLTLGGSTLTGVGTGPGTVAAGNDSRITGAIQSTGGTLTGPLSGTSAGFSGAINAGSLTTPGAVTAGTLAGDGSAGIKVLGRSLQARAQDTINVLDVGVTGDGVTDDAPKIRALLTSNRNVIFPGGRTYYLCSSIASIYPASDLVAMLATQVSNLHVYARGATFKTCPAIGLSQAILFDRSSRWSWDGGTFIGDRTNLTASQENVGFGLFNNVDFRISNTRFTGYGGTGGAFVGDFNVNGTIRDVQMDGVGIGFDMAFHKNVHIDNVRATGADTNGMSGPGQVGQKFFSNIFDVPLSPTLTLSAAAASGATSISYSVFPTSTTLVVGTAYPIYGTGIPAGTTLTPTAAGSGTGTGTLSNATTAALASGATLTAQFNFTGFAFTDTDGLSLVNSDWSNFASGVALASGSNYKFFNNNSHDNPGISSAKGLGYYLYYNASGIASSVGHPVNDVTIYGGQSANNGSATPGYGILVDASTITNSDVLDGIIVNGVLFDNNNNIGIGAIGTAITNFNTFGNSFKGAAQTTPINAAALNYSKTIQQSVAGGIKLNAVLSAGSDLGLELARTGSYDWQYNASASNGNLYLFQALTNKFPFTVEAAAATDVLRLTSAGAKFAPFTVATLPSCATASKGAMLYVTDATAPTYGGALTGGGTVLTPVFCNGSAWTSH